MKPALSIVLVVALAGCSEYELFFGHGKGGSPDGDDTDGGSAVDSADSAVLDDGCDDLAVGVDDTVAIDPASLGGWQLVTPVADPWHARVEWTSGPMSSAMPAVGNVTDDDGDGDVDEDDRVDVVYVTNVGDLRVVDGATGAVEASWPGFFSESAPALGDLDGDGVPEILQVDSPRFRVNALEPDGTVLWIGPPAAHALAGEITLADLDEDGTIEVLWGDQVLDGATGALKFSLPLDNPQAWGAAAVGDVDGDGDRELVWDGKLIDSDGAVLWDAHPSLTYTLWPMLVQADDDDDAEIVLVDDGGTQVYDTDGTLLHSAPARGTSEGAPAAGDFDGDGETEIAIPWYFPSYFQMLELDGTEDWVDNTTRVTGTIAAGASGADLDGDGALEVVYACDQELIVYDGATGARLIESTDHLSGTILDFGVVADVDHDDAAEIVTVNNALTPMAGITVFGHDGAGWAPTGPAWASFDFRQTDIGPDLSLASAPEEPWTNAHVWRARNATDTYRDPLPDLGVAVADACVASCDDGPVRVAVRVDNHGSVDVPAGTLLTLYAVDGGTAAAVGTQALPAIAAGQRLKGVVFDVPPSLAAKTAWRAVVDDDGSGVGAVVELHEDDDVAEYADELCP